MSENGTSSESRKCSYCGIDYPTTMTHCVSCGSPSPEYKEPQKGKSIVAAVLLAFFLGPLGLLYANILAGIFLLICLTPFVLSKSLDVYMRFIVSCICTAIAIYSVKRHNGEYDLDSEEALDLLNEAAKLEKNAPDQAVIKYREIITKYPQTSEAKEAERNIETLTMPKLPKI